MSGHLNLRECGLNLVIWVSLKLQPLIEAHRLVFDPTHRMWDAFDTSSDQHLPLCKLGLGPHVNSRLSFSNEQTCSICWSDITEYEFSLRHTVCNTVWHEACLQAYVNHMRSDMAACPCCRSSLVEDAGDVKLWKCTWSPGPIQRLTKRAYASCVAALVLYVIVMIVVGFGKIGEMTPWQETLVRWLRIIATCRAQRLALLELHNELLRDVGRPDRLTQMVVTLGLFIVLFALNLSPDEATATTLFEWPELRGSVIEICDLYMNLLVHGCWSVGWLRGSVDM